MKFEKLKEDLSEVLTILTEKTQTQPVFHADAVEAFMNAQIVNDPTTKDYWESLKGDGTEKDKFLYICFSTFILPNKHLWPIYVNGLSG